MKDKKSGLISQVAIFFAIGALMTGILTYVTQHLLSDASVRTQTEKLGAEIAAETTMAIKEYPAYAWLLRYWYSHADELDIEYDVEYRGGTQTEAKCRLLSQRYPKLQLKYASTGEVATLPKEDQKRYAEIAYSWLITRLNQIKRAYQIDFLFVVVTDANFDMQFFLLSAADPDSVRGTEYEQVYPLGTTVSVAENTEMRRAMRDARQNSVHLVKAGDYVDYYSFLDAYNGNTMLIGMTYNLKGIRTDIQRRTWRGTLLAIVNQALLSFLCLGLISYFVLKPLKEVQENIRLYKQIKDSDRVTRNLLGIRSRNEIGQLTEDVIGLAREIDDYLARIASITAEEERISTELNVAARIQAAMLPNQSPAFPGRHEFDVYATMIPAKEVGGDFYDYFLIDDTHLALVMADVSGKGVPAALFMMASKIIIGNMSTMGEKDPARILEAANRQITRNNPAEMFVTVWLGVLDLTTGKLTAANAGHEYPYIGHSGRFELFRDRHGVVLGALEGSRYRSYELQLEPGDAIFVYTDGVAEANNAQQQLFGTGRLTEVLNANSSASCVELVENVKSAVDAFVQEAPQFDDTTMLAMRYYGPGTN